MDGHETTIEWDGRLFYFRCSAGDVNLFTHRFPSRDDAAHAAHLHEIGFDVPWEMMTDGHRLMLRRDQIWTASTIT